MSTTQQSNVPSSTEPIVQREPFPDLSREGLAEIAARSVASPMHRQVYLALCQLRSTRAEIAVLLERCVRLSQWVPPPAPLTPALEEMNRLRPRLGSNLTLQDHLAKVCWERLQYAEESGHKTIEEASGLRLSLEEFVTVAAQYGRLKQRAEVAWRVIRPFWDEAERERCREDEPGPGEEVSQETLCAAL